MRWFCSFKAYGDLVICCNFLRRAERTKYGLLAGSHLQPLLNAISFDGSLRIINVGNSVPPLFDSSKCGYFKALKSGFELRKKMGEVLLPGVDSLVFDKLGVREHFLAWPLNVESLHRPVSSNIYLDYARYMGSSVGRSPEVLQNIKRTSATERVFVFPDSRIKNKELPDFLILKIVENNTRRGKDTIIVKIGTEPPLQQISNLNVRWIYGFNQLVTEIGTADAIVSADSLPAHLAEYLNIPVFVFTPKPNDYWMPLSSFLYGNHSTYDIFNKYEHWDY
jgi:hypothetical protein